MPAHKLGSALRNIVFIGLLLASAPATAVADAVTKDDMLIEACRQGDLEQVQGLLAKDCNVNAKNRFGTTPLLAAADHGHLETASALVHAGADLNGCDKLGITPLIVASRGGYVELVKMLLQKGVAVDAVACLPPIVSLPHLPQQDGAGHHGPSVNALMQAVAADHLAVVRVLLEKGSNVNAASIQGITPLMYSSYYNRREVAEYLLANGADIDLRSGGGRTALMWAILGMSADTAKLLISMGSDVNEVSGSCPWSCHVYAGDLEQRSVTEVLIDFAECNASLQVNDMTLLMAASHSGLDDVVKLLLQKRVALDVKNSRGKTATDYATEKGHREILDLLKAHGAN